jgi:hypothetical protein
LCGHKFLDFDFFEESTDSSGPLKHIFEMKRLDIEGCCDMELVLFAKHVNVNSNLLALELLFEIPQRRYEVMPVVLFL